MSKIEFTSKNIYIPEKRFMGKVTLTKIFIYAFLSFWALTAITPMLWVIINSFKSTNDILTNALSLPTVFDISNFQALGQYAQINISRGFFNSLVISGSVVVLVTVIGAMGGFVLGRFKFFLNGPIKLLLIASMLIPQFAVILPNVFIFKALHFNGTFLAVITPHTAGFLNFAIIMMAGFMKSLPNELEEAAIVDGCSIPRILFQIILPLSKPILATTAIMIFLWSYNDLLLPLVYLPTMLQPISVLMTKVSSIYDTNYGAMMAAVTIIVIPVIILYTITQEWVIKGMTQGAVKG
jgi:raffinose/stachyose/melibiose transport system permease protein